MRYLRYAFLAALAICLISVAMANRGMVELRMLPAELGNLFGLTRSVELPLFIVILGSVVAGLMIGFVWEWLREHRQRAEAARKDREMKALKREMQRLKQSDGKGGKKDEVLALLDEAS